MSLAKDARYENPKLEKLQQILQDQFHEDCGSRGIVFVRTRQGAHSLFQWVQDSVDLQQQGIKAAALTGAGYSNQTKHMTQVRARFVFLLGVGPERMGCTQGHCLVSFIDFIYSSSFSLRHKLVYKSAGSKPWRVSG